MALLALEAVSLDGVGETLRAGDPLVDVALQQQLPLQFLKGLGLVSDFLFQERLIHFQVLYFSSQRSYAVVPSNLT